jgi:hypothetical protein
VSHTLPPRDDFTMPPPSDPGPLPELERSGARGPVIGSLAWDRRVLTYLDLALFLDDSDTSYTGDLLALIAKADPGNRGRLARVYPAEVLAWSIWVEIDEPTAAALLGLMVLAKMGGAVPGDPAATVAAAEWSPGLGGRL